MAAQWHFVKPKPGDKKREPILEEATAAIRRAPTPPYDISQFSNMNRPVRDEIKLAASSTPNQAYY